MNRPLKKVIKYLFVILGILLVFIIIVIVKDDLNTSYLKTKNNQSTKTNSYLITNVNVVPMHTDTILLNKSVYVKNGIIHQISDSISIQDVQIINAQNNYLLPGLIDMHVHVWDKYELGLYLSNGVTAVRNVWGLPMHLRLKNEILEEEIIAPMFFTSSPKLTGKIYIGDDNLQIENSEQAIELVKSYKKRGFDFIKTYNGLEKEVYDAIIKQSEISGIDIISHPSNKVEYRYHFQNQIKSIEHAEEIIQQPLNYKLDTLLLDDVLYDFTKNNFTSFCPTLIGYQNIYKMLTNDTILKSEQIKYINPLIRKADSKVQFERWQKAKQNDVSVVNAINEQHKFHLKIIKQLNYNGTNIICGTDAGIGITVPGFSIHEELALYKEAGLSNYEVLKTATINPSKTHNVLSTMGTIEHGKIANLLLLENNPLENLSTLKNPFLVFIKGEKLDKVALQNFKDKAINRNNFTASALRYLEYLSME